MKIIIPGDPIALNRPRFYQQYGHTIAYDNQKNQKRSISRLMASNFNQKALELPCHVSIEFFVSCPISDKDNNLRLWNLITPTKRDIDNLIKFVLDCGNGILWQDDRLITSIQAIKKFSKNPCTIISFDEIRNNIMGSKIEKVFRVFDPAELEDLKSNFRDFSLLDNESMQSKELLASGLIDFADTWVKKLSKIRTKD